MHAALDKMKKDIWKDEKLDKSPYNQQQSRSRGPTVTVSNRRVLSKDQKYVSKMNAITGTQPTIDKPKRVSHVLIQDDEKSVRPNENAAATQSTQEEVKKFIHDAPARHMLRQTRQRRGDLELPIHPQLVFNRQLNTNTATNAIIDSEDMNEMLSNMHMQDLPRDMMLPIMMEQTAVSSIKRSIFRLPKTVENTTLVDPSLEFGDQAASSGPTQGGEDTNKDESALQQKSTVSPKTPERTSVQPRLRVRRKPNAISFMTDAGAPRRIPKK